MNESIKQKLFKRKKKMFLPNQLRLSSDESDSNSSDQDDLENANYNLSGGGDYMYTNH